MISLYNNYPSIDLHGFDRDYARIKINEFIEDNYKQKKYDVLIIHGIGSGILKKETHKALKNNKLVDNYKLDNFNSGTTIVRIKKRFDK